MHIPLVDRERNYRTRLQHRRVRGIFPFSKLPAELRNQIYKLSLDLTGIETYFDKRWKALHDGSAKNAGFPSEPRRKCPTILLLNRRIFSEAQYFLGAQTITLSHGLLDLHHLSWVVAPQVLRRVGSIIVSTTGHRMLAPGHLALSWWGYLELMSELADHLGGPQAHALRKLHIRFDDAELVAHNARCWSAHDPPPRCDFRDQMMVYMSQLCHIRGVRDVVITGPPDDFAQQVRNCIMSPTRGYMALPMYLRQRIYAMRWL